MVQQILVLGTESQLIGLGIGNADLSRPILRSVDPRGLAIRPGIRQSIAGWDQLSSKSLSHTVCVCVPR